MKINWKFVIKNSFVYGYSLGITTAVLYNLYLQNLLPFLPFQK
jgi:hypothetical protein